MGGGGWGGHAAAVLHSEDNLTLHSVRAFGTHAVRNPQVGGWGCGVMGVVL